MNQFKFIQTLMLIGSLYLIRNRQEREIESQKTSQPPGNKYEVHFLNRCFGGLPSLNNFPPRCGEFISKVRSNA
ncbi:hypothetical protein ACROYT_G007390 [Oculina patagonica]